MRSRTLVTLLGLLVAVVLSACTAAQTVAPPGTSPTPRRLIIMSAFGPEMTRLKAEAAITETRVINGRSYYLGRLAERDVVLVLSGTSMINAAMTAQTALDHFPASGIVFSGIAGGVNPGLNIGDVTVPAQWGEYQEHYFARQTPQGWDAHLFKTEYGNFGMMFPGKVAVTRRGGRADAHESRLWFPVSPEMLAAARAAAGSVQLSNRTAKGVSLSSPPRVVVGGNGVSGPTFVDNAEYRQWVWSTFKADALDEETAAVAHVAYVNDVPFIAFRSLSDLAGGGPGENQIDTFMDLASDNSAAVVLAFLKCWQAQ